MSLRILGIELEDFLELFLGLRMQFQVQTPSRQLHALVAVAIGKLLNLILVCLAHRVERPGNALLRKSHHAEALTDDELLPVLRNDPLDDLAVGEHQVSFRGA